MKYSLLAAIGLLIIMPGKIDIKVAIEGIGKHLNFLPLEKGITLPLIAEKDSEIIVVRLVYLQIVRPGENLKITAPKYAASYNLSKNRFIGLKNIESRKGGEKIYEIEIDYDKAKKDREHFEYSEIWEMYNLLIPAFQNRKTAKPNAETIAAAKNYRKAFKVYAEKPLLQDYKQYGGEFLTFVGSIAK